MDFPDQNESGEEAKPFVKLKDKESIKLIFRGKPLVFHTHWVGASTVICPGRETCPRCQGGEKNNFRFRLDAVVNENGIYVAKVFEQGWKLFEHLRELNKDAPLEKNIIKVTRTGSTKNDTSYFPVPVGMITADLAAKVTKVPMLDLSPVSKQEEPKIAGAAEKDRPPVNNGSSDHFGPPDHMFTEENIPF